MKSTRDLRFTIPILVLLLGSLACGLVQPKAAPTRTPTARILPTKTTMKIPTATLKPEPTLKLEPTQAVLNTGKLTHMWATTGEASSEYGSKDWSALQVGGAPNSPDCTDAISSWAALNPNTVESITAYFMEGPLIPTQINIVQNYHPSQVVKVELIDAYAEHLDLSIYAAKPKATNTCPYTLSIPVTGVDYPVMGVRITIDQSVLGLGWNEIDAVEMVGYAENSSIPQNSVGSSPATVWENVSALPIFPSAENVNYPDEQTLMFGVSGSRRLDVLNYVLTELEKTGWLLDVDNSGKCRHADRCISKADGVDYSDPSNDLWFLVPSDNSSQAYLMLLLSENSGSVYVSMKLDN
jgi:hypothetical protein